MLSRKMSIGHRGDDEVQLHVHSVPALEACGYSAPCAGRFSIGACLNGLGKPRLHRDSNPGRFIKFFTQYAGHSTVATGHSHHSIAMYRTAKQQHGLLVFKNKLTPGRLGLGEVKG